VRPTSARATHDKTPRTADGRSTGRPTASASWASAPSPRWSAASGPAKATASSRASKSFGSRSGTGHRFAARMSRPGLVPLSPAVRASDPPGRSARRAAVERSPPRGLPSPAKPQGACSEDPHRRPRPFSQARPPTRWVANSRLALMTCPTRRSPSARCSSPLRRAAPVAVRCRSVLVMVLNLPVL
jgi:hypothetical protein